MGDVKVGSCVGQCDHKMVEFLIFGEGWWGAAKLLPWTSGGEHGTVPSGCW